MALHPVDVGGEHLVPAGANNVDLLDFESGQGQPARKLGSVDSWSNEFIEPFERNSHAATLPAPIVFGANFCKNRRSFPANARTSSTPWRIMTMRSIPKPKANPEYLSASYPTASRTLRWTMPAPPISNQPECLQTRHPVPSQMAQSTAKSTPGSTNGKKSQRKQILRRGPKSWRASSWSTPLRSARVMCSSTAK